MVDKVHGTSDEGQFLSGGLQYFTVTSTLDISATAGDPADTSQARLDKIVQTISLRGQPVILGAVTLDAGGDLTQFAGGSGTGNVYTLQFAVEHPDAWTAATLETALVAAGFTTANINVAAKTF